MLGQEAVSYDSEGFQVYSKGADQVVYLDQRIIRYTCQPLGRSSSDYSYLSFFMRGEYNYKELYYADFSLRTDASSRFGKDHRWGTFWSLGCSVQREIYRLAEGYKVAQLQLRLP